MLLRWVVFNYHPPPAGGNITLKTAQERGELVLRKNRAELRKFFLLSLGIVALLIGATPGLAQPMYDGLYVLDGYGNVHTVDSAPVITAGIDFGFDTARDIALTGNETGYVTGAYLLTGPGDVFGFGDAPLYEGADRPYFGWDIARDL
jgi:hypothetical protein